MTEIAKAYVQIIPTTKGITNNLNKELGGIGEKAGNDAGDKAGKGFLSTMGKVVAAGAAAIGGKKIIDAIGNITKQAVSSYADYEQLVGGVQTLFGLGGQSLEDYAKSQGKAADEALEGWMQMTKAERIVLNNADEAYKTAGLSANQYMETVTSFSASLLQSLGGDTAAAAEVADTAITDMADNANKMGYFQKEQPMLNRLNCWKTLRAA